MSDGYANHADYMARVADAANARATAIAAALRDALKVAIRRRHCDFIEFSELSTESLAAAIQSRPDVLKPLLVECNVAGRAIARDLRLKVDTYRPRLSTKEALTIARYILPFLPRSVSIEAVVLSDRTEFIDTEIRKGKGAWERQVCAAFNALGTVAFKKRKFSWNEDKFELDVASPPAGPIRIGVDVKRVEGDLDIHKRSDEIVNKADKFKHAFPKGQFAAEIGRAHV